MVQEDKWLLRKLISCFRQMSATPVWYEWVCRLRFYGRGQRRLCCEDV